MMGEDVFAILPTGFGKSATFQLFPLMRRTQCEVPLCLIVSPLKALMKDQVQKLTTLGLDACTVNDLKEKTTPIDNLTYLFGSPEDFIRTPRMLENLKATFSDRVCLIAVDEVHTIHSWGEMRDSKKKWQKKKEAAFRKFFSKVGEIRSFFPSAPVLALTATATLTTRMNVMQSLSMTNLCHVIEETPDRPNLRYSVIHIVQDIPSVLFWLVDMLNKEKENFPRTVFYCYSIDKVTQLYTFMKRECPELRHLFGMHHSETDEIVQDCQINEISSKDSSLRLLFCTSALGMGIDMKGIYTVVHYGPPVDIESYVQETGRGGRDQRMSHAVLLHNGQMLKDSPDFKAYVFETTVCRREQLMSRFCVNFKSQICMHHTCCDNCDRKCTCMDSECHKTQSYLEHHMKSVNVLTDQEAFDSSSDSSLESDAESIKSLDNADNADNESDSDL